MKTILAILVAALLSVAPLGAQQSPRPQAPPPPPPPRQQPSQQEEDVALQDDDVLTVESDLTNVLFTATDKQRRFVSTLKLEDIRLLEDGTPQEIFTFQKQTDLPLSLAIVMDRSRSQAMTLGEQRAAATSFIDSVLRARKDEAAVVSFTGEVFLEQGLTGNITSLRRAVDKVEFVPPTGYGIDGNPLPGTPPIAENSRSARLATTTALWDAVWVTCEEVLTEAPPRTRRAMILLTDGLDKDSQYKLSEAVEKAVKSEVIVFCIGIGDYINFEGIDEGALRKIAERTGGRAFFPRSDEDLRAAFAQIERELREQYLIAYSPKNKARDDRFREVKIEIVNPELRKGNLKLTYRPGYFRRAVGAPSAADGRTR